jgi:hypothetical protein
MLRAEKTGQIPTFHRREVFISAAVASYSRTFGIVLGALRRTGRRAELVG